MDDIRPIYQLRRVFLLDHVGMVAYQGIEWVDNGELILRRRGEEHSSRFLKRSDVDRNFPGSRWTEAFDESAERVHRKMVISKLPQVMFKSRSQKNTKTKVEEQSPDHRLTDRMWQIAVLYGQGKSSYEIAKLIKTSASYVRLMVSNRIPKRVGLKSKWEIKSWVADTREQNEPKN